MVALRCTLISLISLLAIAATAKADSADHRAPIVSRTMGPLTYLPGVPGAVARLADQPEPARQATATKITQILRLVARHPKPEPLPAELVHVRISKAYLESFIEQEVRRQQEVADVILGTSVRGQADTQGRTHFALLDHAEHGMAEVQLVGTIESQTVGINGPVRLHCTSHAPFASRKVIHFTTAGIRALPAETIARASSKTHSIQTTLPGLRGRIAERVAWQRAAEMRAEADRITSRRAADRLSAEFDRTIDASIESARTTLRGKFAQVLSDVEGLPTELAYCSTPDYLQMTLRHAVADAKRSNELPQFDAAAAVSIRVHRSLVQHAWVSTELQRAFGPLLIGMVSADVDAGSPFRTVSTKPAPRDVQLGWSSDRQWLSIDFLAIETDPVVQR